MSDLELITSSIEVPKNTGIEGFVHTVRALVKLPRIQSITISARGKITYERYVGEGEKEVIGIDYTGLQPWHILRNAPDGIEELLLSSFNAAVALCGMLDRATAEKLFPVGFVASPNTALWQWYQNTTSFALATRTSLCGLPIYFDREVPDSVLLLCAAFSREGALIDTQKAYKVEMDYIIAPKIEVEVLDVTSSS